MDLGGGVMKFGKFGLTLGLTQRTLGIGIGCVSLLGLGLWIAYHQRQGGMASDQIAQPATIATASTSSNSAMSQATSADQALLRSLPQWDGKLSTPETIGFTNPDDRLRQVKVGRSDPFAPTETLLLSEPTLTNVAPSQAPQGLSAIGQPASAAVGLPLPPPPTELVFLPQAPSVSVSAASPLTVAANSAGLPANSTPLSPTHLADQMEIKGVVEFENQWQAIVREPESTQSKTVRAGDALAGGQVKVRRIERSRNGVLQIVLEQNGIEVIRPMS